jgi:HK97 family phage prohead protease
VTNVTPIEHALVLPKRFAEVQHRSVEAVDVDDSTGTIRFRAAPYEVETQLGQELFEVFTRGAFANATKAPSRFRLFHEHRGPLVGAGQEAEDLADGFYVNARFASTPAAQEARSLVLDGFLDSVSVEFRPMAQFMRAVRRKTGMLVRHDKAHALGAAIVAYPAYETASVVSARDDRADREREERIARLRSLSS